MESRSSLSYVDFIIPQTPNSVNPRARGFCGGGGHAPCGQFLNVFFRGQVDVLIYPVPGHIDLFPWDIGGHETPAEIPFGGKQVTHVGTFNFLDGRKVWFMGDCLERGGRGYYSGPSFGHELK